MSVDRTLKIFGALLLLVSVSLPMATCTRYEDAEGMRVEVDDPENLPEGVQKVVRSKYALEHFDPFDGGEWLKVLAFVWPVFTLASLWWKPRGPVAITIRVLEVLLVAGSFFLIEFISSLLVDRRAIGAYLAFFALGLYGVGAIWSDFSLFRSWKAARRT